MGKRNPSEALSAAKGRRKVSAEIAVAVVCFGLLLNCSAGAQQRPQEYAVKAAYLFNFGKFAKWPAESPNFNICILGKDPFAGSLDRTVAGEAIEGKPIAVRKLADSSQIRDCQILFVSTSERAHLQAILAQVQNHPILTVSDMPEFMDHGGIIQFELQNDRVRFSINLKSARDAKLNISSDLLSVASRVEGR